MADKKMDWTSEQHKAVTHRGRNMLVSASAGTGKTAVLSGRCAEIAKDEKADISVLDMLVLTFTEAAADEMRSRIAGMLRDKYLEAESRRLRRQLILLQGSDISTIHSFCKRLITEYFYKLELDPAFRVIDEDEQKLLKTEVLEETIDWAWEQQGLREAMKDLLRGRDLRTQDGFLEVIVRINGFLDGVVSRENWFLKAEGMTREQDPAAGGLGKVQKDIILKKLRHSLDKLRNCRKIYEEQSGHTEWSEGIEQTHIRPVLQCIEHIENGRWAESEAMIADYKPPRTCKPNDINSTAAESLHALAKDAVDGVKELKRLAVLDPEYKEKTAKAAGVQTAAVIEMAKKFSELYGYAKQEINGLDFADLEHFALRLLTKDVNAAALEPSDTAVLLRKRYKHILVDEYQDVNPVQKAILDMLGSGNNVFAVGDIKQSIYAFRGARPEIFAAGLKSAGEDPKERNALLRVDLTTNWRSDKRILDFVNMVFGRIMTGSFAGIDYDSRAVLKPDDKSASKAEAANVPAVEIRLTEKAGRRGSDEEDGGEEDNNGLGGRRLKAAMTARRIRQMVGADGGAAEFTVYDRQSGTRRDVQYRDIVVLMRSPAMKVNDYVDLFQLAGIPVISKDATGYFEATEISDMLSLLKVLDNPQRDIELAAVLRGPVFGFTDTELAMIGTYAADASKTGYYGRLLSYIGSGPQEALREKLRLACEQLSIWRLAARNGRLADLIWRIYREKGLPAFFLGLPNGRQRRANLLKLHDRAVQFEGFVSSAGSASLTRFVEFIEKLQESDRDWASAEPQSEIEDAVRIISVHKSKGLEFPVVFLAETDGEFNRDDARNDVLVNEECTVGLKVTDPDGGDKRPSLAHQIIAEQKLSGNLAEEMRILYVALTRARERLVITGQVEIGRGCRILAGAFYSRPAVADWQLYRCKSLLEWILCALADRKGLHGAFGTGLEEMADGQDLFSVSIEEAGRLNDYVLQIANAPRMAVRLHLAPSRAAIAELEDVKKILSWKYSYKRPDMAAKSSVTQLTHRDDEYAMADYSKVLDRRPKAVEGPAQTAGGRIIGSAAHLLISRLDLKKPVTAGNIEQVRRSLVAEAAMTEDAAGRIDIKAIMEFFNSDLGRQVLDPANTVQREWPFTFSLPALSPVEGPAATGDQQLATSDFVIVQGIIDILVEMPQGLLLIDFKTDNVTSASAPERAETYRSQLELYGRAAEKILKKSVCGRWLYFLKPRRAVKV